MISQSIWEKMASLVKDRRGPPKRFMNLVNLVVRQQNGPWRQKFQMGDWKDAAQKPTPQCVILAACNNFWSLDRDPY